MKIHYLFIISATAVWMGLYSCHNGKGDSAQKEVFGLQCVSNQRFPVPDDAVDLMFPNGDMRKVKNQWPVGGWLVPDGNKIAKTVAALVEYNQAIPKPAEIAYAMNMTLGEYDFICSRIKTSQIAAAWDDPALHTSPITFIADGSAPGRCSYLHLKADKRSLLRSPDFRVRAGKPHFMSLWVRSRIANGRSPEFIFWYGLGLEEIGISYFTLPDTQGEWKRYGFYFRAQADVDSAHFTLYFPGAESDYMDVTGFELRSATEGEFSTAYAAWRTTMPEHRVMTSPDDGQYLAASLAKLEGKLGVPYKPFVIWGVGSSWTNGLDDVEPVRQAILSRFPNAPDIIYRKQVGSGSPYDYIRGWVHTMVLADQPDLILSYTNGSVEALEEMLKDIRRHSTADIIIPSLHFFENENGRLTPEVIEAPIFDEIKAVCEKYNAQFVDNRRAMAQWLLANDRQVKDLLSDAVHQNSTGRLLTCENIARQFVGRPVPAYDPGEVEEAICAADGLRNHDDRITFSDGWSIVGSQVVARKAGSSIKFVFTGNRIDLAGMQKTDGGSVEVWIDGRPAREAPAFAISYINPALLNISHMGFYPRSSRGNSDTGPHGVWLGAHVVPQQWTIRMTDDAGNYELTGSVAGKDSTGNNTRMFVGRSGQIIVDPAVWRHPQANVKGDSWTFTVTRCAVDTVNFASDRRNEARANRYGYVTGAPEYASEGMENEAPFSIRLAQNLDNKEHTVELRTIGEGEVAIESFYVFRPQ